MKKRKDKKKRKQSLISTDSEPISSLCNILNNFEGDNHTVHNVFALSTNPITSVCNSIGVNVNGVDRKNRYLTTTNNDNDLDDLESCLALMDQKIMMKQEEKDRPTCASSSSSSPQSQENVDNHDFKTKNRGCIGNGTGACGNIHQLWKGASSDEERKNKSISNHHHLQEHFYLPNIQIELARHKHLGDLSKLLLSKCPKLRMPSFERWLIDSKLEERKKRQDLQETNIQLQLEEERIHNNNKHFQHQKFKKELKWKQRLKRKRSELKSSLDRHLTSSGKGTLNEYDVVIPTMADIEDSATQRLIQEIQASNSNDNADTSALIICRELCQQACTAGRHIQNLNNHLGGPTHVNHYLNKDKKSAASNSVGKILLKMNDDNNNEGSTGIDSSTYSLIYSRKSKKGSEMKPFVLNINSLHYYKLREMYNAIHKDNEKLIVTSPLAVRGAIDNTPAMKVFHHLVFVLLLRYASLAGGQQLFDLRGGGMQGAIHSQVFDSLSQMCHLDSIFELFASPLNVYNRQYCSLFHQDLDYHFGSCGDFFTVPIGYFNKYGGKVHEVNPPFSPGLMFSMVERLIEHLEFADYEGKENKSDGELTFVVVVPTCTKKTDDKGSESLVQNFASNSFNKMIRSAYFTKHIMLKARDHGYVEGSQHLRNTRFKESQYNTSIIILQSEKAKKGENSVFTSEEFESEIRKSFCSRHLLELNERRMKHDDVIKKESGLKSNKRKEHHKKDKSKRPKIT